MSTQIWESKEDAYLPINISDLADGFASPCEIYAKDRGLIKFLFAENTFINDSTKQILQNQGIKEIFIKTHDRIIFEDYKSFVAKVRARRDDSLLFKNYSLYKSKQFPVDRIAIGYKSNQQIDIGLLKYPSYGILPIIENSSKHEVIKEIIKIGADIVIPKTQLQKYKRHIEEIFNNDLNNGHEYISLREILRIKLCLFFADPANETFFKELLISVYPLFTWLKEHRKDFRRVLLTGLHDTYFEVHACNVAILSAVLGFQYGFGATEVLKLFIGALFHDIGKLSFNHELVDRQGKLNTEEITLMKTHPDEGIKILERFKPLLSKQIFEIVAQHHERCDGKGYPQGLTSDKISQYTKIVTVADVFDALIHPRPHREAVKPYMAFSMLKSEMQKYDKLALKLLVQSFE